MAEVARGFVGVDPRRGASVGILPARASSEAPPEPPLGYPNPWVEIPVHTHLSARGERGVEPQSRNHLVVLTADVVVAMPGGAGTRSEVELALAYGRPVIAHLERREELPGLPVDVLLVPNLEQVLALVRHRLCG
jgi:predicted Rossmann-fold nucleotide-binding protein